MIPVPKVEEPDDFDREARQPGNAWLSANPGARRPKDFWSPFRNDLCDGFAMLCGYAAMRDPTGGTVDHYLSFRNRPDLTYEWSNYRFASSTLNTIKRNADAAVLDPYEVGEGWFEIILPSLQMRATSQVPPEHRARAEDTLMRLKLRDDERLIRWRRSWFELYVAGDLTLDGLARVAPLIAAAVRKQLLSTDEDAYSGNPTR
ncbi:MAG TPA: hypothetical protein VF618_23085 [Thermoanaerobaculia bacterium]